MKNKIITLFGFFLLANCSLSADNSQIIRTIITVNSDPTIQAQYKDEWTDITSSIDKNNPYAGRANIWGGGLLSMHFWFEKGDLWDYMDNIDPNKKYILHTLVNNHTLGKEKNSFIDGKTAIMVMPASASPKLSGALYIVRISNNTIYRTKSEWGFAFIDAWDGEQVDIGNLIAIATNKNIKNHVLRGLL
ncbi:MAG: hypothetical protein KFW21_06660 [Spirochaetota bacterium]|nr:hypothetical protein [Spirochaetota bacterium]